MQRAQMETLVTDTFSSCPFCLAKGSMRFEWGHTVAKEMTCSGCGAKWELLFGLNEKWAFLGAKLASCGSTKKGSELLGKMYDRAFWDKAVSQVVGQELPVDVRVPDESQSSRQNLVERVVVIKEIVKIRCPYCGGLYDEVNDRCPYCGGKR